MQLVRSSAGTKTAASLSGAVFCTWIVLHVAGNLTAFAGARGMDHYAAALRQTGLLLWAVRLGLFISVVVHVHAAASLRARARAARPVAYAINSRRAATLASRTMGWGGAVLLTFVAYHLLHLTFGVVHPKFHPGHVYDNVVTGLRSPVVASIYVGAAGLVGLHLFHALWALPRSLGLHERNAGTRHRTFALVLAAAVAIGLAAVPLAILGGIVR